MPIGAIGGYLVGLAARERARPPPRPPWESPRSTGRTRWSLRSVGGAADAVPESRALTVLAAAVLVLVAARTVQQAVRRYRRRGRDPRAARAQPAPGVPDPGAMTAVNPATVITFVAVVLGRAPGTVVAWATVVLFAVGAFGASATWQLLLVGGGSLLGRLLRGRRGQLGIALCSAASCWAWPWRCWCAEPVPTSVSRRAAAPWRPAAHRWPGR